MLFLIIGLACLASTGASGFFLYYFLKVNPNDAWAIVFAVLGVAFIIGFMLSIFFFVNKKNLSRISDLKTRLEKWRNISYHASKAGDEAFNELPIGIVLYDKSYQVTWSNAYAKEIFNNPLNDIALASLSRELYDEIIANEKTINFTFNDHSYDVIHNSENDIMYFFDVTEREQIKKRYNDRTSAVGIIEIDNLDESLKRYDMQEKANIRGQIFGELSDWISVYNCYLQSITGDRMMILFDKQSLQQMIDDNFSILSSVREISSKNRLKSSISMGIACYDIEYDELGAIAQTAIELALKRGGDQVVVNLQGEKIKFIGGNTNSLEKNTLIDARMQATALKEAVEGSSNVIIMCHNFADCDAIGSMMATYHMVASSGVDVKMVFDEEKADVTVKKIFNQMKDEPNIKSHFVNLDEALDLMKPTTLLIITDTQSPTMVMFKEIYDKAKRLSIIDHHRAGEESYKEYLTYYVESSASSAVELVSEMFTFYNSNISFTPLEASIMLAGIIVDTNNFTMRSGTRTFEAAATLKTMGADMIFVRKLLQEPLDSEKILASALMHAEVYGNNFGIVCLRENQKIEDRTTLAKISDKQLTISGVEASFTIGRLDANTVGISARSLGDSINVQTIMEQMGGGGHFNSAATQIKNTTIQKVREDLIELLRIEYVEGGTGLMKVILTTDIKGRGKKDSIIEVATGYGNYLIINKQAIAATDENIKKFEEQKAQEKKEEENRRKLLLKLKDDISGKSITVKIKVGAGGKSFGSVTTKLVCDEFELQNNIHLDKKKVELPGDITSIGIYTATVKLDTDIIASFEVKVEEMN